MYFVHQCKHNKVKCINLVSQALAVAPDLADHGGMHKLVHDHPVAPGEVPPEELRAVGDLGGAVVALQPVLHF